MIYVIATVIVHPESQGDFLENARTLISASHKEAGCDSYDLLSSITEPNQFIFIERWQSREALSAHFEAPHFKQWREMSKPWVVSAKLEIVHPDTIETP